MSARRRELMVELWQDVTALYPLSAFVASGPVSVNLVDGVLTVTTESEGTYRNAVITPFEADPAYSYHISCHINPVGGDCRLACRDAGSGVVPGTSSGPVTEERDVDIIFDGNQSIRQLTFFITWNTSRAGKGIISNWSIMRRLL